MSTGPTPEELREARRQSLLQAHVNGKRLTTREMEEIEDLISEQEAKPKKGKAKEETCKVEWLARISGFTARRIQQLADEGTVPKVGRGEYPKERALIALFEHVNGLAGKTSADRSRNIARKEAAEAEDAELNTAKKAGRLVLRSDYLDNYADAIAQGVRAISRLENLDESQKQSVLAALRSVKLPELEEEA